MTLEILKLVDKTDEHGDHLEIHVECECTPSLSTGSGKTDNSLHLLIKNTSGRVGCYLKRAELKKLKEYIEKFLAQPKKKALTS